MILNDIPAASVSSISCFLANSISLLISFRDSSAASNSLSKEGISSLPTLFDGSNPVRAFIGLRNSIPKFIFTGTLSDEKKEGSKYQKRNKKGNTAELLLLEVKYRDQKII